MTQVLAMEAQVGSELAMYSGSPWNLPICLPSAGIALPHWASPGLPLLVLIP